MSAQRLALNSFLRSGPRIVSAPHNATIAVEGRDRDGDDHHNETGRLVDAVLPFVNFVRNVPLSIDVYPWASLHSLDSGNRPTSEQDPHKELELPLPGSFVHSNPVAPAAFTSKPTFSEASVQTDERVTFTGDFLANSRALKWELQNTIGEREMLEENYRSAFSRFKRAAHHGCVQALQNLGDCYADGLGCKRSLTRAFSSWDKAANAGDLESLYQVALCHIRGEGVARSVSTGQSHMLAAANRGHPDASYYMITLLFREGRPEEAGRFIRAALEDEECEAQLRGWLEMDDLELPAKVMLREFLRHECVETIDSFRKNSCTDSM